MRDRTQAVGRLAALVFAIPLAALLASPAAGATGSVEGRVSLALPGASLASVGPVIVWLEPVDAPAPQAPPPAPVRITQQNAHFTPPFAVVTVGQPVEMPNADAIYHNVFSYSRPNDFDLGIYPAGESRTVHFRHPGVVKTYCSIHESMNATILVLPSRHFDRVTGSGSFAIRDVPPGRYTLRVWCEKLPELSREIRVEPGARQSLEIELIPQA